MPLKKKLKTNNNENEQEAENDSSSSSVEFDENEDSMSDDSDNDDSDSSGESADENEEIMIDFEARALRESDLDSTKLMIQQKLGPFSLNLNELAKLVVQQENIGNAIYQVIAGNDQEEDLDQENDDNKKEENDDDDIDDTIFGVLSILDLGSSKFKSFTTNFKEFLQKQCQSYDKQNGKKLTEKLKEFLNTKKIAYIINERYVNIPPAISVPMFESLLSDLESLSVEENSSKNADYWLFLSKYFVESHEAGSSAKSSKKVEESSNIYSNPEEEIFDSLANSNSMFPMLEKSRNRPVANGRTVMRLYNQT